MSNENQLYAITQDDNRIITTKNFGLNIMKNEQIKFSYSSYFKNLKISKVFMSGMSHMFALTHDGVVFCMGSNEFGQLGLI